MQLPRPATPPLHPTPHLKPHTKTLQLSALASFGPALGPPVMPFPDRSTSTPTPARAHRLLLHHCQLHHRRQPIYTVVVSTTHHNYSNKGPTRPSPCRSSRRGRDLASLKHGPEPFLPPSVTRTEDSSCAHCTVCTAARICRTTFSCMRTCRPTETERRCKLPIGVARRRECRYSW
jgi:hypothetical protein